MLADPKMFVFHGLMMDEDTGEELMRYLRHHCPTGGFLEAVLSNDLKESCARADDRNLWQLPLLVAYLYNEAPNVAWGSHDRYKDWLLATEEEDVRIVHVLRWSYVQPSPASGEHSGSWVAIPAHGRRW